MRKALVVGIDYYAAAPRLFGCVSDAEAVSGALERNGDNTVNFAVKLLTSTDSADPVRRPTLKERIRELFTDDGEIALLYFAGHGHAETTGGYLLASDSSTGDDGVPLAEVLTLANRSPAKSRVIILDSCYSGIAGTHSLAPQLAELSEGLTILAASTAEQYASEQNGQGLFTTLLVDALYGSAANLVGEITPGAAYSYIDQALGPWDQRPVFRTNVKRFVSLRRVEAPVPLTDLQRITDLFPAAGSEFPLDPSYEPEGGCPDPANTATFAVLQRLNRVNLVVPVGTSHMYHAAMQRKSCKLTGLGEHYRRLRERGRI